MGFMRADSGVRLPAFLMRFLLIFLPASALFTLLLMAKQDWELRRELEMSSVSEAAHIEIAANLIEQDFSVAASDLRILAVTPVLLRFLGQSDREHLADLLWLLKQVAGETKRYDSMSYLDITGREIARINYVDGTAVAVPRNQLGDKSALFYFRDANRLARGEIYVSPIELSTKDGKLVIPFKPIIRFAMPVFDSAGHRRGILLFSYLCEGMLRHFREGMRGGEASESILLNRDGYWLSSPRAEDEWGFMPGREARNFGRDHPEVWRTISNSESGTLRRDQGVFVYGTVYPLRMPQRASAGSQWMHATPRDGLAADYQWKIVSLISEGSLRQRSSRDESSLIMNYIVMGLIIAVISYFSLGRKLARIAQRESEQRLRDITNTVSDGLLVLDLDGRITFANPEAQSLLGYPADELLGANMCDLLHVLEDGRPMPRIASNVLNVGRTGITCYGQDELFKRKDGILMPVLVSASAIIKRHSVAGIVVAFHDISERKQLERELRRRAQTDVLTGLYNRRHFYELADQELARARRYGKPLAMLMLDLDHFKKVNDTYGHHAGDAVLRKLSEVCIATLREIDVIGRYGGEEFVVLLPETDARRALEAAERLRHALSEADVALAGGEMLRFTVSIGVANLVATDPDLDSLLKRADKGLYEAKKLGRNRVCVSNA
ncbi:MAG: diguanylate cyclase [Sideroxydans sp.]|nr:diguanylate cyclase [Sideroxydans sp.]